MNTTNQINTTNQPEVIHESKSSGFLSWVTFLLLIILIVYSGYGAYFAYKKYQLSTTDIKTLQSQIIQLNQSLAVQTQSNENNRKALIRVLEETGGKKDSTALNQARHFIQLANVILYLEHNVSASSLLLQTADFYLRDTNNPSFADIREALAGDISKLQSVPEIDLIGTYDRLEALNHQVENLPLLYKNTNNINNSENTNNSKNSWKDSFKASMQELKKVLIIHRQEESVGIILSGEQYELLKLRLHTLFSQAQWAVLQHNQKVFINSLKNINAVLQKYFSIHNDVADHMSEAITELSKLNVSPELPDISDSLSILSAKEKSVIEQLIKQSNLSVNVQQQTAEQKTTELPAEQK